MYSSYRDPFTVGDFVELWASSPGCLHLAVGGCPFEHGQLCELETRDGWRRGRLHWLDPEHFPELITFDGGRHLVWSDSLVRLIRTHR